MTPASTLAAFQDHFADALLTNDIAPGTLAAQPGFAVYRNTVMKGWVDALEANYPAVSRLVGQSFFRAAAAVYARSHPVDDPRLWCYGNGYADFLAAYEPALALTYLPGVARLDRCWTEAHGAAQADVLESAALAGLTPAQLADARLAPHPAARWAWFQDEPVYTIWRRNREPGDSDEPLHWQGEGALLLRPAGAVTWHALDAAGCAFLDACAAGQPLAMAAAAALAAAPNADIAALLARLLDAGAFRSGFILP